jgi:hypothetical protein
MIKLSSMKSKSMSSRNVLLILAFGCAVFMMTVAEAGSGYLHANHLGTGRLTIDRTPNFGWNLGYNLQIDGRPAGSVGQGQSYSVVLPAGRHVLTVIKVPASGYTEPTSTTVTIQPGAEHLYQAMWDSGLVYLHPAGVWLTPGAYWQNRGNGVP